MSSLREQILSTPDASATKPIPVDVPGWGCTVYVKALSGAERDAFELKMLDARKGKGESRNIRAALVAMVACDENGSAIFEPGDVEDLGKKRASDLDRIFSVAQDANGLSDGDVEALEGN